MLLWVLSKPFRPFGTIQWGWNSILGRGEVPRTSCFTSCFQLEWNYFFFWKKKENRERETLPFFWQVSVTSGLVIVICQWAWHGTSVACPYFANWLWPVCGGYFWFALYFSHCREPLLLFHQTISLGVTRGGSQCVFIGRLDLLSPPSPLRVEELCGVHWDAWHRGWDLPPLRSDIQHTKAEVRATCLCASRIQSHCMVHFHMVRSCQLNLNHDIVPQAYTGANRALHWCWRQTASEAGNTEIHFRY